LSLSEALIIGPPCGVQLRLIAFVTAAEPVQRILTHPLPRLAGRPGPRADPPGMSRSISASVLVNALARSSRSPLARLPPPSTGLPFALTTARVATPPVSGGCVSDPSLAYLLRH